jgi:hypothetical protein
MQGFTICASCGYIVDEHRLEYSSYQQSGGGSRFALHLHPTRPRHFTENISKRVTHFKYWLLRLQGRDPCHMTLEEKQRLTQYLEQHGGLSTVSYSKIREALKRLRLQQYYNNTHSLLAEFQGTSLIRFEDHHMEQLMSMFLEIQDPFQRHASSRVNMMSYTYLIQKFSEILGWEDVAWSVPSMKSDANIRRQDEIWKRICEDLGYPFIRSLSSS